jgi:predicted DsbA family dithiol-disulfide isomerase
VNSTETGTITVDVVSDVMCPWCYIGKKNLEAARKLVGETKLEIRWHPFQLDPALPAEGKDRRQYLADKFGGDVRARDIYARVEQAGEAAGIDFAFERIKVSPNTLNAHRLIRWAGGQGPQVQDRVVDRLFQLYFEEGANIGDVEVLADAGASAGMDRALLAELLASDADKEAVEQQIRNAQAMGVSGVPCFIFGRKYAVMGAQPSQKIAEAIIAAADS